MTQETFDAIAEALNNADFYQIWMGIKDETPEDCEDDTKYGLSFNVETDELTLIDYITTEDKGWVSTYESQNPCIIIGYVGAEDIIMGDPAGDIISMLREQYPDLEEA